MACDLECGHVIATSVAGLCVILTLIISIFQVMKHLKHFTNGHFQQKIIIIIFMAPFYAITSFGTVVAGDTTGYFDLIRDVYESVLIYAFFNLLALYVAYDYDREVIDYNRIYSALATKGVRTHAFPMNLFLSPMILISDVRAQWHFRKSRLFILQYLAIKPLVSFFVIVDDFTDGGDWFATFLQYVACISVCMSMYYLVLFYKVLHDELAYAKPLLKFLSIKGVLFFTFWQDYIVEFFVDRMAGIDERTKLFIIVEIENMLVCIEMVVLTILTTIAFSYKDFRATQKKGLMKREGIKTLTKKLVNNVFNDGFVNVVQDLKDLREPLRDPFKKYRDANIELTDMLRLSEKLERGLVTEEDLGSHVTVFEKPVIIQNFIKENKNVGYDLL